MLYTELYERLTQAGLHPRMCSEIAAANYPSPGRTPARSPVIPTHHVNFMTEQFLDVGSISITELWSAVWATDPLTYFGLQADDEDADPGTLGLSKRVVAKLRSFPYRSEEVADRVLELDAVIDPGTLPLESHDATVAQLVAVALGRSEGRHWSEEHMLILAGAFVSGARLAEAVLQVPLPLPEPWASGDYNEQAAALIDFTSDELLEFMQNVLPREMLFWLIPGRD